MIVTIDPPSGLADSYFDLKFRVMLDVLADMVTARVYNETSGEQLDFLAVHSGYMIDNKTAVFEHVRSVEAFFNLFNDDRFNRKFSRQPMVNLRVDLEIEKGGGKITTSHQATFYNEAESLDAGIIPVDVMIERKEIDLAEYEPLHLKVICGRERLFEFVIQSPNEKELTFTVRAKPGVTDIDIPAAVLYHDLGLRSTPNEVLCSLFYIKRQGITSSRFMARRYIPVANCDFTIRHPKVLMPIAQECICPSGSPLNHDFILSDRYFVPTLKPASAFRIYDDTIPSRTLKLVMHLHEAQDMGSVNTVSLMKAETSQTSKEMTQAAMLKQMQRTHKVPSSRIELFDAHATTFDAADSANVGPSVQKPTKPCGCSR